MTMRTKWTWKCKLNLHESSANGAKLDHSRDIGLDISLLADGVGIILDGALEIRGVEGSRDETLVDTSRGTEGVHTCG